MRKIKIIVFISLLFLGNSCKDFEELQFDPNRAIQTHPSLILTNIEASAFRVIDVGAALASRMMVFTDGASAEQYYNWQRAGFGRYEQMRQVSKMTEEARRLDLPNYSSLGLFLILLKSLRSQKYLAMLPTVRR